MELDPDLKISHLRAAHPWGSGTFDFLPFFGLEWEKMQDAKQGEPKHELKNDELVAAIVSKEAKGGHIQFHDDEWRKFDIMGLHEKNFVRTTNGPTSYYKPVGKASPDASASLQTVNMLHRILGRRVVGRHHFTRVGHSRDFPEDTPAKARKTSKELL